MEGEGRFDGLFTSIAQTANGIEPLMDSFFSFLARKTDFYQNSSSKCDPAKDITLACFEKHRSIALDRFEKERQNHRSIDEEKERRRFQQQVKPSISQQSSNIPDPMEQFKKRQEELRKAPVVEEVFDDIPPNTNHTVVPDSIPDTSESDGPPPVGNGGVTDKYTWTQLLPTVDVYIPVPKGTTSRQCQVTLTSTHVKIIIQNNLVLEGQFHDKIKQGDSFWTLEDHQQIHLVLEKYDTMKWWSCVIKGDTEIDTRRIVPENSKLSELDPELRQTVEKMMFDQEQKALGLPTSAHRKQAELLETFKKAHPEMDFSNAKINNWQNSAM